MSIYFTKKKLNIKIYEITILIISFFGIIYIGKNKLNWKYDIYRKMNVSRELNGFGYLFMKSYKIFSSEETIKEIVEHKKSIARFGDGEFRLIFGKNISFQIFNKTLKNKLLTVLKSSLNKLLVGIFKIEECKNKKAWNSLVERYKVNFEKILDKHKIYYSSFITRLFSLRDHINLDRYMKEFKKIWNNRDILIIEGEKTRIGIGNDLFKNSKSIKRIIGPYINAFNAYDKILEFFKKLLIDKNTLILIALGPTATVLSYDLTKMGYQAIDIGHLDIQYEYYKRNVTKPIKISYKYVNEVEGGRENIIPVEDKNYYKQILVRIS